MTNLRLGEGHTLVPTNGRRVLMISAGMTRPKKLDNPFSLWHRYLNYGLLGLATRLSHRGYEARVFHGHFEEPVGFVERLDAGGWLHTNAPLFLSIPSSYALLWTADACREIRRRSSTAQIVIGGRWVVAQDGAWIRRQIPEVDLVVYGLADELLDQIMLPTSWRLMPNSDLSEVPSWSSTAEETLSELDYRLLEGHLEFTPSFEVSRGCGRRCEFCAEAEVKLSAMKSPSRLAAEVADCMNVYDRPEIRAFFEASMFMPGPRWARELSDAFQERGIQIRWRTETRVDNLPVNRLGELADCGLHILDLGLESASPRQLARMEKTTNPKAYLRKASDMLRACHDSGIWTKVNVLLYPGEDESTVGETREWLDRHAQYIKGVSAGPMILYRYGASTPSSLRAMEAHGATAVRPADLDSVGFTHLHLSDKMSHTESAAVALAISRSMMTARDYFDLKSFNYFPPTWTLSQFMAAARDSNSVALPFETEAAHPGEAF